jgi:hypothetical protein
MLPRAAGQPLHRNPGCSGPVQGIMTSREAGAVRDCYIINGIEAQLSCQKLLQYKL